MLWVCVGALWLVILSFLKNLRWTISTIYPLINIFISILFCLYITVLKTTVEINNDELRLIKTPFNLLGTNIKLENISHVYCKQQILSSSLYNVKAELTNGKTKKLFFGLKEDAANELAEHIDKSIKHFQKAQLIQPIKPRPLSLND